MQAALNTALASVLLIAATASAVAAQSDTARATGEEITTFLSNNTRVQSIPGEGADWNQVFYANGHTDFAFGKPGRQRPSSGKWTVERDQYCSQWPPSPAWACYWVEIDGDTITWESVDTGVREAATRILE